MIRAFGNNAFFLQTTRERLRPATLISWMLIAGIIILLHALGTFSRFNVCVSRPLEFFWLIACWQGFLLLGVGVYSTAQMALRERTSGTLEFHRASPSPAEAQVAGLLLGAPSLEWLIFFMTVPVSLLCAAASPLGVGGALEFYAALVLTAALLHLLAMFVCLNTFGLEEQAQKRMQNVPIAILLLLPMFLMPFVGCRAYYNFPQEKVCRVASHLVGFQAWEKINALVYKVNHAPRDSSKAHSGFSYGQYQALPPHSYLFGYQVPGLGLQVLVQLPFFMILIGGVARIIRQPHVPSLSKPHLLLLAAFVMFMTVAEIFQDMVAGHGGKLPGGGGRDFAFCVGAMGVVSALMATPRRLTYVIGLRKCRQSGLARPAALDDHASNGPWLICYIAMSVAWFLFFSRTAHVQGDLSGYLLVIALLQVATFASALEAFSLSAMGNKRVVFVTGLAIFWIFLPVFATVAAPAYQTVGKALSPLYVHAEALGGGQFLRSVEEQIQCLLLNATMLCVTVYLAFRQRSYLKGKA